MDNKDLYNKAMDEIHAPEDLKRKTLNKIEENSRPRNVMILKYASACAVFVLAVVGTFGIVKNLEEPQVIVQPKPYAVAQKPSQNVTKSLNTFKDINELKEVIEKNSGYGYDTSIYKSFGGIVVEDAELATNDATAAESRDETQKEASDFSTTNVQVEGVDEADVVKTDGKYIYYVTRGAVHIIEASTLEEINTINYKEDYKYNYNYTGNFTAKEIYLVKNKLVVVGSYSGYELYTDDFRDIDSVDYVRTRGRNYSQAVIYDVSNPRNYKVDREIKLDGNYASSRMIGNDLYFISTKRPTYYKNILDTEILPHYNDSLEEAERYIPADQIVYFKDTNSYSYVLIAGVDITKKDDINVETFFGSVSDKIYASENNLYIPVTRYSYGIFGTSRSEGSSNDIYKFKLNNASVEFVAKGTFEGYLDSQFSIDEYQGFLRLATTSGYDKNATNTLFIFDANMNEVSRINNIARGERIYSVRFMGKVGYIVTFEQVDPLFVVDLSDPYHPQIKGELEIPGYSSYLHPYDETHIIGIGYNVKSNGYGGVKNDNMKMAMFDVSDLSNPKEMFSVDIGEGNVYSEINNNHKALFYSKTKNLIGFPITSYGNYYDSSRSEFTLYSIDLREGFKAQGTITDSLDYAGIQRVIYIEDDLFVLTTDKITKYDLNTFYKLDELTLKTGYYY